MNRPQALELAVRLINAFPGSGATAATAGIFAERLARMDPMIGTRAIERLVDTSRRLPTVADLWEAYNAEGGEIGDTGRDMSPPVGPRPDRPSPEEQAKIAELRTEFRRRVEEVRGAAYGLAPDDERRGR